MVLIIFFISFFIFLFVGSFLNVVIERVYRGEQFIRGRSYCVSCKHELSVIELFPAICAGFIFASYPFTQALFFSLILVILVLIFFTDLMYYVIPDIYLYILFGLCVIGAALLYFPIWDHVRAALFTSRS